MAERGQVAQPGKLIGRAEYLAAAFPSACGKTNPAMLAPPEGMTRKGYRVWTVGNGSLAIRQGHWVFIDAKSGGVRCRSVAPLARTIVALGSPCSAK